MFTIQDGRWKIDLPEAQGPDATRLIKIHPDGTRTFEVVVDRQTVQLRLQPSEAAPYDLHRQWRGRSLVDVLIEGSQRRADGCVHWTGAVDRWGHGVVSIPTNGQARRFAGAHRLSWSLNAGVCPANLVLNHACHSSDLNCAGGNSCLHRRCVNPEHLELVTKKFNNSRENSRRWAA